MKFYRASASHPNALRVFAFNPDFDALSYAKNKRVNFVDFVYRKAGTSRWKAAFTEANNLLRFDTSVAVVSKAISYVYHL